jgi:solute carrier family 6 serotonin transporter-like protein 4
MFGVFQQHVTEMVVAPFLFLISLSYFLSVSHVSSSSKSIFQIHPFLKGMYMELAIGQYHRLGYITIWDKICPPLKGIGYSMLILNLYVLSYYNTIIAWSVHYCLASFRYILPWTFCNNEWNTNICYSLHDKRSLNLTQNASCSSTDEYYERRMLKSHLSPSINHLGSLQWELVGCSIIVFFLIYLSIFKGVKTAGKAIWFTALIPYAVLIILLLRSLTLDGIFEGLKYYVKPSFERLTEYSVWQAAAVQIFFSLGPGFGVLLSYASFSNTNDNVSGTALIASLVNCCTSLLYGTVVFAGLGYLSSRLKSDVRQFTESNMGLVFVVYPEILSSIRGAPFFSVLFFVMLLTLGLDSVFAGAESIYTAISDEFPILARRPRLSRACVVLVPFLASIPTLTYGGKYIVHFMDFFGTSPSIMFVVLCELIATVWLYGMDKFSDNVETMTGFRPTIYWRITCRYIAPLILFVLYICSFVQFDSQELSSFGKGNTVLKVSIAGWTMSTISTLPIPIYACWWLIFRRQKNVTKQSTTTTTVVTETMPTKAVDEQEPFI